MANVNPIPDTYHRVTPYLHIRGAAQAIDFYRRVFDAAPKGPPMQGPDGKIGHAEIMICDSTVMLADEMPDMGAPSPETVGGTPMSLVVYVADCDAVTKKAADAGATVERQPEDQFYGDRAATIRDPFGFRWDIHTHVEDVSPEEMGRRMAAMAPAS
jgi:PhnB protein